MGNFQAFALLNFYCNKNLGKSAIIEMQLFFSGTTTYSSTNRLVTGWSFEIEKQGYFYFPTLLTHFPTSTISEAKIGNPP